MVMIRAPCRGSEITTVIIGLAVSWWLSRKKLGTVACAAHSAAGEEFIRGVGGLVLSLSLLSNTSSTALDAFSIWSFAGPSGCVIVGFVVGVVIVVAHGVVEAGVVVWVVVVDVVGVVEVGVVVSGVGGLLVRLRHFP